VCENAASAAAYIRRTAMRRLQFASVVNDSATHVELGCQKPDRVMAMHTLSSAARAVGVAKSTIHRAIKAGRLPAHRLTSGTYAIYPGQLRQVFRTAPSFLRSDDKRHGLGFPIWDVG
jgi:excisionase family DNA binding protein